MEDESTRLRELLAELHAELARNPPADERSRAQLDGLRADIARYGADPAALAVDPTSGDVHPHGLRGRLQEMIVGLEGSHPQLASAIEQTMNALSNMGL